MGQHKFLMLLKRVRSKMLKDKERKVVSVNMVAYDFVSSMGTMIEQFESTYRHDASSMFFFNVLSASNMEEST